MPRRREINVFSISFLDLITGALGAVIILYVAVPKSNPLEGKTQALEAKIRAQTAEIEALKAELVPLKGLQASAQAAIQENERLKLEIPKPAEAETDTDVGFKFKGKRVVFVVDTSQSMLQEDRMGQVKAGLKMLITSMPSTYEVDVVQFPQGMRTPFKALYGQLRTLGVEAKQDVFDFIYKLKPLGGTPTRDVMTYVLQKYPTLTDVVLLTDGEPSIHNSALKDDIHDLLAHVRRLNAGTRVQINTVGVGEEVLHDKTANPYKFLKLLAEQNAGFFVGF